MTRIRRRILAASVLLLFARILAAEPAAPTVAGEWQGALDVGGATLHLAFHLEVGSDGALAATMDSVDQKAFGLPVAKATLEARTLRLELPDLGATYEGALNAEGTEVAGKWTQGPRSFPLTLARGTLKAGADAQVPHVPSDPIKPTWLGTIDVGVQKLRTGLHLSRDADGFLTATMDSIDQGASGIPVDRASYKDRRLILELPALLARFEGTVNEAGTELTGTFTQGGKPLPLTMTAVDEIPKQNRPQEPKGPLPYLAENVSYRNEGAGVKLAGTLTLPKSAGPFPAVLLITGSGPEDRDETVFGHKPFLILADHLTRQGIAVLRVDDRGVGGSDMGAAEATSEDFAGDALAGVAFLLKRKEVDPKKIGLIGHSEGGLIAPIAAVRSQDVKFIVLMAAPGLPGDEILMRQAELIAKAMGESEEEIAKAKKINATVFRAIKEEKDPVVRERRVREAIATAGVPAEAADAQAKLVLSPWFRYFITYDPRPMLAKVKVPVLAMGGERDLQVPAKENIDAIRAALTLAQHQRHELVLLPGLNHLFQECETGSPAEYAQIEQTMSPAALKFISDWILGL